MQLTPADAQMYWLAERIPNDQFLVFCFATPADDLAAIRAGIRARVARVGDLRVALRDVPGDLDYPYRVPRSWSDELVVGHRLRDRTWRGLTAELGRLVATTLDPRITPWQLHVFPGIRGVPRCNDAALVAVLRISHAVADGRGATALARALFGPAEPPPVPAPPAPPSQAVMLARALLRLPGQLARTIGAGRRAAAAGAALEQAVESGVIPGPAPGFELASINTPPGPERAVRMVVCDATRFRAGGVTVTVAALTAVSLALPRFLDRRGDRVPERLGAEVTVAVDTAGAARNRYRNAGVDLFVSEPDLRARAGRIAGELAARRTRLASPLFAARDAASAHVPARLLRSGIDRFRPEAIPASVTGNTVLSSVPRGAADLSLGGGPAVFSAGFPALSPVMALTHGVYGLGDTVTVGIAASPAVIPDLDGYEQLLRDAIGEVAAALGG